MKKKKEAKELTTDEKLRAAIKTLQEFSGIRVTRTMICRGVFAKPDHIFYIAKSKAGIEIRYEIDKQIEKQSGEVEVIREIIRKFPIHSANVN